jgi:hypothetical protein
VHPALTLTRNGNRVWIAYYVQQLNEKLRTDLALLYIDGKQLRLDQITGLSNTTFDLTLSKHHADSDRKRPISSKFSLRGCDIGEYMSATGHQRGGSSTDGVVSAWGDNRNTWTGSVGSVVPYTHAQADVFFGRVGTQPDEGPTKYSPRRGARTGHRRQGRCQGRQETIEPLPMKGGASQMSGTYVVPSGSGLSLGFSAFAAARSLELTPAILLQKWRRERCLLGLALRWPFVRSARRFRGTLWES